MIPTPPRRHGNRHSESALVGALTGELVDDGLPLYLTLSEAGWDPSGAARAELVRKIEQRPYYGYQVLAGAGYIPFTPGVPGQNAGLPGFLAGGRIYEKFGADKRLLYGFHGEFFGNFDPVNGIAGGFVGAAFQYQLNDPNLNDPTIRVGGAALGFLAGQEGNTFALEATADVVLQFRFGLSVAAFYMLPVDFAGGTLGGPGAKARFLINW